MLSKLLRSTSALILPCACAAALGCQPDLPRYAGPDGPDAPTEPHALLEPDAPFDAAPPVVRVRIVPEGDGTADSARVLFVRGHVGDGHVRQVAHGDISKALTERVLPAVVWLDDDGSAVLAPSAPLEPDTTYGVLSGDPPLGIDVRAASDDPLPLLARVWPPPESPEAGPFAILCGEADLPVPPPTIRLSPADLEGVVTYGAAPHIAPRCIRIDASLPPSAAPAADSEPEPPGDPVPAILAVPPPLLAFADGSFVRLDPQPILLPPPPPSPAPPPPPPPTPLDCAPPAVPFGPGCAAIADDRIFVETPASPLLWIVRASEGGSGSTSDVLFTTVRATAAGQPWVLRGLTPSSPVGLTIVALDTLGRPHHGSVVAFTQPPLPHVILTEVLANPLGAEPDQEWVELHNDGLAAADLSGYTLLDIGGETPLPAAILAPGAFALLVNETFVPDDGIDPSPAPGTLLLPVAKLGKDGLKNDGEPLKLLAPDGSIVSRFPLAPKPKAGHSVARIAPSAPDGDPASFTVTTPTPGLEYTTAH